MWRVVALFVCVYEGVDDTSLEDFGFWFWTSSSPPLLALLLLSLLGLIY